MSSDMYTGIVIVSNDGVHMLVPTHQCCSEPSSKREQEQVGDHSTYVRTRGVLGVSYL